MIEDYNFDHYQNITPGKQTDVFNTAGYDVGITVCGGDTRIARNHTMPNSLVTFNRFWLTYHNTANLPDQPTIFGAVFWLRYGQYAYVCSGHSSVRPASRVALNNAVSCNGDDAAAAKGLVDSRLMLSSVQT